ncbi:MAG: hypothetical protein A3D74_04770 [Candidatus Levybacteria bacterium RIFCSPHIGHO2_02_FULL_37_13]|nr:MAG: hypothetical protein A3D74_04770 [Candidatus Levybacteria bacterium RIFCSPHIGHO2_02_FULL_37_13]
MNEQLTSLPYDKIAQEVKSSRRTDRHFEVYKDLFGFTDNDLKNKTILDIGAGDSGFAIEAAKIAKRVIRLDSDYSNRSPEYKSDAITAIAQELPFRDDTFDETLASVSLYWIKTGLNEALSEMIRVTKPEGKIRIYPAFLRVGQMAQYSQSTRLAYVGKHKSLSPTLVITKNPSYKPSDWKNEVSNILACVDL